MTIDMQVNGGQAPLRHFRLVRQDLDIEAVRAELAMHREAWLAETGRQARAPAQRDTNAIPLRGLRRSKIRGRRRRDVHESRYTTLARRFPATTQLLESLAAELGGRLGRARLALLPPGKVVLPHVDRGDYYRIRDRYHLVIRSEGGSPLRAGDEQIRLREGELWWFDNKALHDARNTSGEPRVHLIFDLLPAGQSEMAEPGTASPSSRPLLSLLQAQRQATTGYELASVATAMELYVAALREPDAWSRLLADHALLEDAETGPVMALCRLCWPGIGARNRRRLASAVSYCLAQIDLGRLKLADVPATLAAAGGIDTIHAVWRRDRDAVLYGSARRRPAPVTRTEPETPRTR